MKLVPCTRCRRHVRMPMSDCPFCGTVIGVASMAAALSMAVTGCGPATTPAAAPVTTLPANPPAAAPIVEEPVAVNEMDAGVAPPIVVEDAGTPPPVVLEDAGNAVAPDSGVRPTRPRRRPVEAQTPPPRNRPRMPPGWDEPQPLYGVDMKR